MGGVGVNKIRENRRKMGWTQIELAKALNISQGSLSGYETGKIEPDMTTMRKMADLFGVTLDALFGERIKAEDDMSDDELWELREQVRRDPERHYLFSLAKDANIDDVRQAVAIIDALKKTKGGD